MTRPLRVLLCLALLLALAGCDYLPFGFTPIGDIVASPGRFEGQTVKVKGEVVQLTKLPLLETKSYLLRDKSGEILVVTEGSLPAMHRRLAIRAAVKTMAIIDGQSYGLRLREIRKLPHLPW